MAVSVDQFGKALVASGVMSADDVKALWGALPADARPKTGDAFAKHLIVQGKLTQFQADELLAGRTTPLVMGDYVLLAKIGEGGMGQVFKARHKRMNRIVALKVMSAAAMRDEASVKRFQREVHAAARLEHPNIVTAYDSGEVGSVKYLVMQFVDGGDLSSLVKKNGPVEIERAVDYVIQAARGLAFSHGEGVIHRDIKPANLLLDKKGVIKILDMGLARIESSDDGLTATEQVMGTVDYMSPEQAANTKSADGRADIYSLGCTLWYLLTAKKLYEADTMISRLMAHRDGPLPSLVKTRDDAPWPLEQALHKMIAKRAEDRYQTMDEVVAALAPFAGGGVSPTGMGSSIGQGSGPQNAELASFLKSVGPGVKPQAKPAASKTNVEVEATAQFVSPEVSTDPKSEIIAPSHLAAGLTPARAANARGQAPRLNSKPPLKLIAGAIGGLALLLALGGWLIVKNKPDDEVARLPVPEGGSVTVATAAAQLPTVNTPVVPESFFGGSSSSPSLFGQPPSVPVVPPPPGDYALTFKYVTTPLSLNLLQGPLTFEAYVTPSQDTARQQVSLFGMNRINLHGGKSWGLQLWKIAHAQSDVPPVPGKRTHVAGVFTQQSLRIFIDGVLKQTADLASDDIPTDEWPFQLGFELSDLVDEVRLSKTVRYDKDFTPQTRFETDADTLLLYHCDEGAGDVLEDSSGNGYHGKIVDATWVKADGSPILQQTSLAELFDSPDYVWSEPANLGPNVNGPENDHIVGLTNDELRLYFRSKDAAGLVRSYEAVRGSPAETFGKAQFAQPMTTDACLAGDGLTFVAIARTATDKHDLIMQRRPTLADQWDAPVNLGPQINSPDDERRPTLSSDGLALLFSRDQNSKRGYELWISRRNSHDAPFGPRNKVDPAVNRSDGSVTSGLLLGDGQTIVFRRDGMLYLTFTGQNGAQSALPLRNHPFGDESSESLELWFAPDGRTAYFSADRPGGLGGTDVWVTRRVPKSGTTPAATPFFTASLSSGVQNLPAGKWGLRFEPGQYVTAHPTPLRKTTVITTELWLTNEVEPSDELITLVGGPNGSLILRHDRFGMNTYGSSNPVGAPAVRGRRIHLAGVNDGKACRLYLDGKLIGQSDDPGQFRTDVNEGPTYIAWSTSPHFRGVIDAVRISSSARYDKDFTPPTSYTPDKDTFALYLFDEGQGTVLKDSSGNGYHGKITGATWVRGGTSTAPPALQTRWPLAASKPEDIQWLVGLGAKITLRVALPSINSSADRTITTAAEIPPGAATIVGVELHAKSGPTTDADLARISGFGDLETLEFADKTKHDVTHQGWSKLAALKNLRSLTLNGTGLIGAVPDFMASLPALESLSLPYLSTDEWARVAAAAPALKKIQAYRTSLTDDGLALLEKRPSLQEIDLRSAKVTQAGIDRFAAAMPQCRIKWGNEKNPTVIEPRVPPPSAAAPAAAPPPGDYVLEFRGFDQKGDRSSWADVPSLLLREAGPLTIETRVWILGHNEGLVLGTDDLRLRISGGHWTTDPLRLAPTKIEYKRWYHLAAVRTDGEVRMYVDGKRIDAKPFAARTGPQPPPKTLPLKIGGFNAQLRLDEIRISKTVRYDQDFTPAARFTPDADTLALYHCDDGAGDVLKDSSGHGHDGQITNPKWVLPDGSAVSQPAGLPAVGVVYLDDLQEVEWNGKEGLGKHGLDIVGRPFNWKIVPPKHSLVMQPITNGSAVAAYDLDGRYETFAATVAPSIDKSGGAFDALTFHVWGDDRELWKSAPMPPNSAEVSFTVSVAGVRRLKLEVVCPGDHKLARSLWLDPRLTPAANFPPPVATPGVPIDVLALIDPVTHRQNGVWQKTNGVLQSPGGVYKAIRLPISPSDSYRLEMLVARTTGTGGLSLGLVVGGHDARFIVDSLNRGERLTMVDVFAGIVWDDDDYAGPKYVGTVFRDDGPTRLQVEVTPTSIVITADDKKIVEYSGQAALIGERYAASYQALPGTLWLGGYGSEFQISKLTYTPLTLPHPGPLPAGEAAQTLDLLPLVDVAQDGLKGAWSRQGAELHSDLTTTNHELRLPVDPGEAYSLRIAFAADRGYPKVTLPFESKGLVVGFTGGRVSLQLAGPNGDAANPGAEVPLHFGDDKRHDVQIDVTRPTAEEVRIAVVVDGKPTLDWTGTREQLKAVVGPDMPEPVLLFSSFLTKAAPTKLLEAKLTTTRGTMKPLRGAPAASPTINPAAPRWPLAPSKPEDIQRLRDMGADVTLRIASGSASEDKTIFAPRQPPAGPATIVGVNFHDADDAALTFVAGLPDLEVLTFVNAAKQDFTSAGLLKLTSLIHLRRMDVVGPKERTLPAIGILKSLPALESLQFPYDAADEWARAAAERPSITAVNAFRTKLTDAGLALLEKMPQLTSLDLVDCAVTKAAVDRFHAAVPGCRIIWGANGDKQIIEPSTPQ